VLRRRVGVSGERGRIAWALAACVSVSVSVSVCVCTVAVAGCASSSSSRTGAGAGGAAAAKRPSPTRWEKPLLYRVEGAARPSYLLGTIHISDPRLDLIPDVIARAFDECDALFLELKLDQAPSPAVLQSFLLPSGSLSKLLPPDAAAKLKEAAAARGMPFAVLDRVKPWLAWTMLMASPVAGAGASKNPWKGVEQRLVERAKEHGHPVYGLETFEEQIAVFDALTTDEQVKLLLQALGGKTTSVAGGGMTSAVRDAYFAGDEHEIEQMLGALDNGNEIAQKLSLHMFRERNPRMVTRILERLAEPRAFFFAVGAAHLVGADGVVARLRRAGRTVTRVE
jgi:uncharacterized protein